MLRAHCLGAALLIFGGTGLPAGAAAVPRGEELPAIVARLEARALDRARALGNYKCLRTYRVANDKKNFHREYPITMEILWPSGKRYQLPDPPPTGVVFKLAFKRLLDTEVDNARPGIQKASAITSANYKFNLVGREDVGGEPCWRLGLKPRRDSRFLIKGYAWVSCADGEIVKLEGRPAEMPSFWMKDIWLVRTFQKVGGYWLPRADRSVNQVRIFGETRFEIDYLRYEFDAGAALPPAPPASAMEGAGPGGAGSLPR
jgi:hypothetical protein